MMDRSKYILADGIADYKNRTVLAVVRKYLQKNPNTTFDQLKKIFPDRLQGSYGIFKIASEAKDILAATSRPRHFLADSDLLTTADGIKIAICTEWALDKNFIEFIEYVNRNLECKIFKKGEDK